MVRCFVLVIITVAGVPRAVAQDARARFLDDYESQAYAVSNAYTNVSVRISRTTYTKDGAGKYIYDAKFKANFRNCHLYGNGTANFKEGSTGSTAPGVAVQNSRYSFELRWQATAGKWVMTGMVPAVADTKPNLGQFCQAYANFRPTGRSYLDLAKDANVKVIDYTDGMLRKQHVKQLTVEVAVDQSGSRGQVTNRLVFSFRTDLRWVCVGCQGVSLKGNHDKNWEDIYNYTQSPDGWPVPKSFETYSYSDNTSPDGRLESLLEFVKFVRSPVPFPDADFTLSAFGFPEPVNLPERQAVDPVRPLVGDDVLAPPLDRPSRWPLWLALAAGGLVITGVGLAVRRRLGRRRAVAA